LRYLFTDNPAMSQRAKEILQNQEVLILTQVIAKTIYVAEGVYNAARQEIVDSLLNKWPLTICILSTMLLLQWRLMNMPLRN
jgi:predicted nucleic acid-binding protein